jgi:thiol:disulfide interchange protein DsbD
MIHIAPGWSRFALLLACMAALDAAASIPVPEGAHGAGAHDAEEPRVEARLLVNATAAAPGDTVRAGVLFTLDPGWHIYWRNSGESGLPTELDWQISTAAQVGPIAWPAPSVFREADGFITTYGYADEVLLAADVTLPPDASGAFELRVAADFLACEVQCIPGRIDLERSLPVAEEPRPATPAESAVFAHWAQRVPRSAASLGMNLEALYSQSAIRPGDTFEAALAVTACAEEDDCRPVRLGAAAEDAFVPEAIETIALDVTGERRHPTAPGVLLALTGRASSDPAPAEQRLRGVLSLRVANGATEYVRVDVPLPRAAAGAEVAQLGAAWLEAPERPYTAPVSLGSALALALLGGLILNLMPCVLPVLAIKVFGITETAQHGHAALRQSGWAYTLGIEVTMLALALIVLALRSAGTAVGWGFQFQEPLFVAAISTVLLVFALNLFGVFEIGVGAGGLTRLSESASGARRSFFEGLLAVVVATPCSAPFLGTAVGFAFASPAPMILSVFLAIGLGLALPYLLVTHVPAWSRWLPRAGAWMLHLRRVLGFALLATVVWLLWVTGRAVGSDGLAALLAFLVAVAFGVWIYGALQASQRPRLARLAALGFAATAIAGMAALPLTSEAPPESAPSDGSWLAWEETAVRAELASGRAVFVDFTADWCLTCKVNERLVLADARVEAEMQRLDVARFKADWTRRDERIRAILAKHGKAGVPMYLLYAPERPGQPRVLPEVLTVDLVIDELRRAAAGSQRARLIQEEST